MTDPSAARIRIAIVDDHPIVREGTAESLAREPGFELIETGEGMADADAFLTRDDIDVLLLDVRLRDGSGLVALERRTGPGPAVVIMTAYDLPPYPEAAMRLGALGFVLKTAPIAEFAETIRHAAAGRLSFPARPSPGVHLTDREREVLARVLQGQSNDEIATGLGIAVKTVETYLSRMFGRFGVSSRTELAVRAERETWLELPSDRRPRT
jgi:DNA-binding NarL/FixJ family response regulator